MPSRRRAIVAVTNDLATDNRVHRTCMALQGSGYDVLLLGRRLGGSPDLDRPYATRRMRLFFQRGPLFYAEFNARCSLFLLFRRCELIVANDLDTLLAAYLASRFRSVPLVYDTHELFTEVPELIGRPIARGVWLRIERWIFPRLRHVITVNASIARIYREKYGVEVGVVRNIPMPRVLDAAPSRKELGLPLDRFILILQGAGINVDRGGEEAVMAMERLPGCLLLIVGGGDAWPELERLVRMLGLQERVRLIGRLPYARMMDLTRNADLGLTLDKDTNPNYRYSLPNKLFDYLNAGIPIVCSDLPEVARIVRGCDAGVVIPVVDPREIAEAVEALRRDPARMEALRANATFAARKLDGGLEYAALKDFLKGIG
ncbi:MAG: glycosyltransferase [Flavobacteriales bacterium]|nr:glycosyltransferase [Flavobacteriales bacterium]MCB9167676.1 glycosyltransferase [Flavobacteriales bacterium]